VRRLAGIAVVAAALAFASACDVTLDAGSNPSFDGGAGDGACAEAAICEGGCVRLLSDPLNCGECDHACDPGASCVHGNCKPATPATGCTTCPCAQCAAGTVCCVIDEPGIAPVCVEGDSCG
jgi:hypothetical protein